jgi:hypothetical protein
LKFHEKGDMKIMQSKFPPVSCALICPAANIVVADLHYSVGKGKCIDTDLEPCDGDAATAKWLGEALDAERPDMVVCAHPASRRIYG